MRGRKPLPTKLKILTSSSPGYDRGGHPIKITPDFSKGVLQKPTDLTEDEEQAWDLTVPELERVGVVGGKDFPIVLAFVQCWGRLQEAARLVRQLGVMGRDPDKTRNPAVAIAAEESRNLVRLASELGLSPSSEVRLGWTKKREERSNPFAYQGVEPSTS